MKNLVLVEALVNGQVNECSLDNVKTLMAQHGATYTVVNKSTGQIPDDLILQRVGDQLLIEVDDQPVAQIDDFYSDDVVATYNTDGPLEASDGVIICSTDPATVSDGSAEVVWQAESTDRAGISPWVWGGGALLGGGLLAAVAGGSSDSSDSSSYDLSVAAAAGPFTSEAIVEVYDKAGNLVASGTLDSSTGQVNFTIGTGYQGPLFIKVSDPNSTAGDYIDETTNTSTSLGEPLRALVLADGTSDVSVSVTPLTELAVRQAGIDEANVSLTEADLAINDAIGALFGVEDITGSVTTILDSSYDAADGIDAAEQYGAVLAMLSGVDSSTGSIDATLAQLEAEISTSSAGDYALSQAGVEYLSAGVSAFETGDSVGADLTNAFIEPPLVAAAAGELNATEKTGGVAVKLDAAVVGDQVTIHWGDQTYSYTVLAGDIDGDGMTTVTVPETTVDAAGDGSIEVRSQINSGELSPAVVISVDTAAPTIATLVVSSDDFIGQSDNASAVAFSGTTSGVEDNQQITVVIGGVSQQVTVTGNTFSGTVDLSAVADSTTLAVSADVSDAAGNAATSFSDTIVLDTAAPTIATLVVSSDDIVNISDSATAVAFSGTTSGVEDNQQITVVIGGVSQQVTVTGNAFNGSVDLSSVADNTSLAVSGTVSDQAGNAATAFSDTIVLDSTDPALQASTPADEATAIALDSDIGLTFNENISLGSGTITITDGSDSHVIDVSNPLGQLTISDNVLTINPTADLANNSATYHVEIDAGAITDTAGNNYAGIADSTTLNFDTEAAATPVNTNIVVFDLVHGVSSSHDGGSGITRTFSELESYTIYIMVDSDSSALVITPTGAAEGATWGQWNNAEALDSNDRIVLVGDGAPIQRAVGLVADSVAEYSYAIQLQVEYGIMMRVSDRGNVERHTDTNFMMSPGMSPEIDLWNGEVADMALDGGAGAELYANAIPANILTSQGLV